jgi:hypothetical protein
MQLCCVLCFSCPQNDVFCINTLRHNPLCGVLASELSNLKGQAATPDAQLTVLAQWMEEQVRIF